MKYFIGAYKINEKKYNYLYCNTLEGWKQWHKDTFSPACHSKILCLEVNGLTYNDRKENLEEKAIEWQIGFSGYNWSYGELATILNFFEINAKRYGLVKEFRENGII